MEISKEGISSTELTKFSPQERFITLPIENYLHLLGVDPVSPQIALINAINNPKYRFVTAALSRRTGKTFIANVIGQLVTLVPGSSVLLMAPNYSLSQISWDLQRWLLKQFDIELSRSNAKDKIIELKNNSTVRMGSVAQADSVVGRSYDLIIFDEAALDDRGRDAFNIQLRPTLDKINSKAIFISTPRGKNWFYDFWMRGFDDEMKDWVSIRATWRDNPRASKEDIENARKTLSKDEFAQEYECSFISIQGQIWNFTQEMIVDFDINTIEVQDVIAGLDIGFRDATAFIVIVTDGRDFYIIDEYIETTSTTSDHARKIQAMIDKHNIDFIYIDSAAQQTKFDLAMNYDISCINAKKSIKDGIGYVASIVDNGRLFVDRSCKRTIAAFENYKWDDREGLLNERPKHDEHSHPADALRYAMYTHSYNVDTLEI